MKTIILFLNKSTSIPNLIDKKNQTYDRAANGNNGAGNSALSKILNGLLEGIEIIQKRVRGCGVLELGGMWDSAGKLLTEALKLEWREQSASQWRSVDQILWCSGP